MALSDRQWPASVVIAVCAGLAMLALAAGPYPHGRGKGILLALFVFGPVVLLRRWSLLVLAVAAAATGVAMAAGNAPLPLGIILGFAVYLVASRLPRPWSVPATVATAAALGAALLYATLAVRTASPAAEAVEGLVPVVAAWFIGDSVAARRRYLAGLAEQAERERAAETERARQDIREERVRIARELHDVVAHTLAVITVQAGVGRRLAAKRPEEASAALESIETIGRTAQDELRVVLGLLREEEAGAAPLAPAPRLADVAALVAAVRASGTPVELQMSGADRQLSPALQLSVYRVIQEALTNVVKHAPGARAAIDLAVSANHVRLEVADDGGPAGGTQAGGTPAGGTPAGGTPAGGGPAGGRPVGAGLAGSPAGGEGGQAGPGTGHGIVGMRERIGAFGGRLAAGPGADRGFRVIAEIPIEGAA